MAKRGFPPKDTEFVEVSTGVPHPPAFLPAEGKREWRRLAPLLHKRGLLTTLDRAAFTSYCQAWGAYAKAVAELDTLKSLVVETEKGNLQQHPLLGIINQLQQRVFQWAGKFGLTPDARSRMPAPDPPGGKKTSSDDEEEDLLDR